MPGGGASGAPVTATSPTGSPLRMRQLTSAAASSSYGIMSRRYHVGWGRFSGAQGREGERVLRTLRGRERIPASRRSSGRPKTAARSPSEEIASEDGRSAQGGHQHRHLV